MRAITELEFGPYVRFVDIHEVVERISQDLRSFTYRACSNFRRGFNGHFSARSTGLCHFCGIPVLARLSSIVRLPVCHSDNLFCKIHKLSAA